MLLQVLDIIRILGVAIAVFFGYRIGFAEGYDPIAQLHFMVPIIIVAIAGISGIEGMFFAKKSAELKGFELVLGVGVVNMGDQLEQRREIYIQRLSRARVAHHLAG